MKKNNKSKLLFIILSFLLFSLFSGQIFAVPTLPQDLKNLSDVYNIFNTYYSKNEIQKEIPLTYIISDNGTLKAKTAQYTDIIIADSGQRPVIINYKSEIKISAELKKVYFIAINNNYNVDSACLKAVSNYFDARNNEFNAPYNLDNKNVVIDKFLIPRTKEKIIAYLKNNKVVDPELCLNNLENNKKIYSYPILFKLTAELLGTQKDIENASLITVKFDPEFLSNIKPINFKVFYRKEPITINSEYSYPKDCDKEQKQIGQCYITKKDIDFFYSDKITSPEVTDVDNIISNTLDNFTVVSSFKENTFENITTQNLLVDLARNREQFCFRQGNENYHKTIFDVAKAYNLSLEQTFQLWAILSEKSNCNYNLNPNLYGFAQLDLSGRDSGNLINIEQSNSASSSVSNSSINIDSRCSKCGPDYFISTNYPGSAVSVGGEKLSKGGVCYKCLSSEKVQRCNPNNGLLGDITDLPSKLKKEICSNIDSTFISQPQTATISNILPLQLAEEEQFQYLALGNFKEINDYLFNNIYNKNANNFYNLGYNGIINNDETYFGFLINAIKNNNKDYYGSTVLFVSDYLKELNYLIKNSTEKSNNPYLFQDYVLENRNSNNAVYILASVFENHNLSKKEKIYSAGKYPEIFNSTQFFIKDGNTIKTTKEIRILINYLAIKRKYYMTPSILSEYQFWSSSNSPKLSETISKYEKLDHKYWDTKKKTYLKNLEDKNIKLMLKKDINHYNYDSLLLIPSKVNFPTTYIMDFGKNVYFNGYQNYINPGSALVWTFDTKKEAIDNYNLIWESTEICKDKKICVDIIPTEKDCCVEHIEVQDGRAHINNQDLFFDGSILGIYNPYSKYNTENREYTHLAIYIGKTKYGHNLIAESTNYGQKISILNRNVRERIKRIYVPKTTNLTSLANLLTIKTKMPQTYVVINSEKLQELIIANNSGIDYNVYYENFDLEGEWELYKLPVINSKCSIYLQKTLNEYINCVKSNLTMVSLNKAYSINTNDNQKNISAGGSGDSLISSKYNKDSLVCKDRAEFNEVIFNVAKKANLTEEETAQLWSKIAAESGCSLTCGAIGCHGDGIGQVVVSTWDGAYSNLKSILINIDSQKYNTESKYLTQLRGQDKNPTSATEISYSVNKYIINELIKVSQKSNKPITAEIFENYDNDNAINGQFITSYNYCRTNPSFFKNGLNPPSNYFSGCVYTSLHKLGYYLAYKRMIYECHNTSATNSFVTAYKNNYGGIYCN